MPLYIYSCPDNHLFEMRAGYDDEVVECAVHIDRLQHCGKPARRRQVYREQSISFKGEGFTRSVAPPPAPQPGSTKELTADEHFEVLDEFAEVHHKWDRETRDHRNR